MDTPDRDTVRFRDFMNGSERALVGSEDFKSFCRTLITPGVGSIPTRSRQETSPFPGLLTLLTVVLLAHSPACAASGAGPTPAAGDSTALPAGPTPAAVDSIGAAPDTVVVPAFSHKGLRELESTAEAPRVPAGRPARRPSVWWTTVRSGVVPGWGQMVNRKPLKAALLFGAWSGLGVGAWGAEQDRRDAERLRGDSTDPALVGRVNDAVDRRNQYYWFMGLTALYGMLDAYVNVHFWNYEEEWSAVVAPGPGGPVLALSARF